MKNTYLLKYSGTSIFINIHILCVPTDEQTVFLPSPPPGAFVFLNKGTGPNYSGSASVVFGEFFGRREREKGNVLRSSVKKQIHVYTFEAHAFTRTHTHRI